MVSLYTPELLVYSLLFVYPNKTELKHIYISIGFLSFTLQILSQILTLSLPRSLFQGWDYWESERHAEQNRVMQTYNGKNWDKSKLNLMGNSSFKLRKFLDIKHWLIVMHLPQRLSDNSTAFICLHLKFSGFVQLFFPSYSITGDPPPVKCIC